MTIIILGILLCLGLSLIFLNLIKKLKNINNEIALALNDFAIDSNDEITITLKNNILTRHNQLYANVCALYKYNFLLGKSSNFNEFKDIYQNFNDKVNFHNKAIEIRKIIDYSLVDAILQVNVFTNNRFFAHNEWNYLRQNFKKLLEAIGLIDKYKVNKYIGNKDCSLIYSILNDEKERHKINKEFIARELTEQKSYFDNILNYPLDLQQRNAIVKSEDNCLVISSAGSGKTSTIVGKAKYLIDACNVSPSDILLISFTRKAAEELKQRINYEDIKCSTFHKLALDIISDYNNSKPSVCDSDTAFKIIFQKLLNNADFISSLLNYFTIGQIIESHDYETPQDYYRDFKKNDPKALLPDMDGNPIYTRSVEEKMICFYLSSLGLDFRYEEAYEYQTKDKNHRQYKPDFSIYYRDRNGIKKRVYLEHFAINKKNEVPKWFAQGNETYEQANKKYNEGIIWKRDRHRLNRTTLIETHSYDFHNGNVLDVIKSELMRVGVPYTNVSPEKIYKEAIKYNKNIQSMAFKMLCSFVNLMKSNCKDLDALIEKARRGNDNRNKNILSSIIKPFYREYVNYLNDRDEIDFTDLISHATAICQRNEQYRSYKYILVDEFQDISFDRYKFLQSLRSEKLFTKLFCVGDDWQSIYRFTGSDMKLFYNFSQFFGCTEECKIETTYRFAEPAITISSNFIQTNTNQKSKNIRAFDRNRHTELSFVSYTSGNRELSEKLSDILDCIPQNKSIYILGRYNFDIDKIEYPLTKTISNNGSQYIRTNNGRQIPFYSVHSSKGLEADYIIIINNESGTYGFPSTIEDDPILTYVLSEQDHYTYAEERRLFYVAITRAKEKTIILYNRDKPSDFVMEIDGNKDRSQEVCPRCKNGNLEIRRQGVTKFGNNYRWKCCTNHVCDYTTTEFD